MSVINTVIYPVSDLAKAKALFSTLAGAPPYDEPYYVGWNLDGQDIGLDPNGHKKGMSGPTPYWDVPDIKAALQGLVDAGATVQDDVRDVGGGKLIATLKDADGNVIGLAQQT